MISIPALKKYLAHISNKHIKPNKEIFKYVRDFLMIALMYGTLLAFSFSALLPARFRFSIKSIAAFGIMFYFIKEEIPTIIRKSRTN